MRYLILFCLLSTLFVSCNNTKEVVKNNDQNTTQKEVEHPIIESVDFYAEGDDQSWKLSVQFRGQIVFTDAKNNIKIASDIKDFTVAQGADVVNLYGEDDNYIIRVLIDIMDCDKAGKIVNVMVRKADAKKGLDYEGCGYYRGAPQLHDIWAVTQVDDDILNPDEFPKELPHFEFNLYKRTMSGFAGCNQVNGQLQFEYNKLIVNQLVSTRMYCGDASKIEERILRIFNSKPTYYFKDTQLFIESPEGLIVLLKVD